jgi:hypothetical protein
VTARTFDAGAVKPGDVIYSATGHSPARCRREARRDFLATAKRVTARVSPECFARFEALLRPEPPRAMPSREEMLAYVISLGIDAAERDNKSALRSQARYAARKAGAS